MIEAGGTKQLLIWDADKLNSLNPETGKVYWSIPLKPSFEMSIMAPRKEGQFSLRQRHRRSRETDRTG